MQRSDGPLIRETLNGAFESLARLRSRSSPSLELEEVGTVLSVSSGVASVAGLPGIRSEEMLRFPNGMLGLTLQVEEDRLWCAVLGDGGDLSSGSEVRRLNRVMEVPVGTALLGRIIDPTGAPLDGLDRLITSERRPIERDAPPIMDRLPVTFPLQTGIKIIDALIPVGRGQRELILGDRQTGKTSIALSAMINQRDPGFVCIYCAIGQRGASVANAIGRLRDGGALSRTVVVIAEAERGPGLQYVAPYAATAIGEYFMDQGRDVLIVYDDLGSHARAYRELSLLMRRPPGREAFPGDIFYLHSRLLERATRLRPERGGGSLTALPIIETEAQNLSAYIPTNLISITDGQIYLSPSLFQKGIVPAVEVGRSVSRVGGKAQLPAYHEVSSELKLYFSQFEELELFARFGTRLDAETTRVINHGRRIRHCLLQGQSDLVDLFEQMLLLIALSGRLFDPITEDRLDRAEQLVREAAAHLPTSLKQRILQRERLKPEDRTEMLGIARRAIEREFRPDVSLREKDGP